MGRLAPENRLRSVHRVDEASSEPGGSSPMTRGSTSLVSTPGGEGVGVRAKLFSHHQMNLPREVESRHFRKKLKEQCVYGSESQHCPHNPSAESSLSSPKGCVIPSYFPGTREEIPVFNTPVPVSHSPGVSLQKPAHILLLTKKHLLCIYRNNQFSV